MNAASRAASLWYAVSLEPSETNSATMVLSSDANFEAVPDEDAPWVTALITKLSAAPLRDIPGVGRFPAVSFAIDKTTLRSK